MIIGAVVSTLGIKHGWSSGVVRGLTLIINLIAMEVTGLNGALSSATTGQIAVIAVIGGIASYLQGGKFGHGFISAGISARIGASDGIKRSMEAAGSIKKLITQVAIGGTVSRIGGGKFANGAGSAAFSMMLSRAYGAMADGGSSYAEKNSGSVEAFDVQKGTQTERITVLIEEPDLNSASKLGRKGMSGHSGATAGEDFYDYGPQPGEGTRLLGSKGRSWWDSFASPSGDASLTEVNFFISAKGKNVSVFTMDVSAEQAALFKSYWRNLYANLGTYHFAGRQCTTTLANSLRHAGLVSYRAWKPTTLANQLRNNGWLEH